LTTLSSTWDESVQDAGLCHGSSGLALVFARLWQHTGENSCLDAARFWIRRTIRFSMPDQIDQPLSMTAVRNRELSFSDATLLTGSIGVNLAVLGATTTHDPGWDEILLLSGRTTQLILSATPPLTIARFNDMMTGFGIAN